MSADEFITILISKCDLIEPFWKEHLEFWEGDKPGHFNDVSVAVHYVIDQYNRNETADFKEIFDFVETSVNSLEVKVSELAIVGFIEGILMVGSHSGLTPEDFKAWLGESSYDRMIKLEKFFSGRTT